MLLFMKCNIAKNEGAPEPWFQSDIIFIIIMSLFSFTNGLFSSIGEFDIRPHQSSYFIFSNVLWPSGGARASPRTNWWLFGYNTCWWFIPWCLFVICICTIISCFMTPSFVVLIISDDVIMTHHLGL